MQNADMRTRENYNSAVLALSDTTTTVQGIVRQSVLNCLTHFHVCLPGLPPCLGHDLFEGIVKFDVGLILKRLHQNNKQSIDLSCRHLNRLIKHLNYQGTDARDKPAMLSDGKAVAGHAAQVWCFLRLLPVLLSDVIDVTDEAWQMLLLLREIVELVCAPRVSYVQILYLNRLISQYLEERLELFPCVSLRPKHHYLRHYPWLMMMFGPLIHVWTMRMETKHTFFKRTARNAHNFVNITKTLSETHQLNQAFISSSPRICSGAELGHDCCAFDEHLFSTGVISAVKHCQQVKFPLHCSSSIMVKGTKYLRDAFVVIDCLSSQLVFGRVMLCLLDSNGFGAVVVQVCQSEKNQALGLYSVQTQTVHELPVLKCVLVENLYDYYPLSAYSVFGCPHIALKHAVFVET